MSLNLSGEVFQGGATTSQHVDAEDDDHFENTTFKLKRTRSLGLLDEFIDPEKQEQQIEQQNAEKGNLPANDADHPQSGDEPTSQSTATATPTPPFIRSPEMIPHDDSDLVAEPSRHVDYLSHQWDVDDISKSWRYVILRRKNVANAARLENASWRTWAQRRSHLKTISPEEVNWLKESDVTWLYGPIVDDDDHDDNDKDQPCDDSQTFNTASSVVAGDISIARKNHGPKPILKKRTVQDMMISHLNLLKLEIATARAEQEQRRREDADAQRRREAQQKSGVSEKPPEYFDYDVISAKLNSQYKNFPLSASNSSVNLAAKNNPPPEESTSSTLEKVPSGHENYEPEPAIAPLALQGSLSALTLSKEKRRIHFNDEVQQCIAIDEFSADEDEYDDHDDQDDDNDYDYGESESYIYENHGGQYGSEGYEEDAADNEDDDEDDDDDDEGGFFLRVKSPSSATAAGFTLPGLSSSANKDSPKENENSDETSLFTNSSKVYKTIHLLPPTTLNYGSSDEESDDSDRYTSSLSHNVDNSVRGYDYYYDYNSVYQVDPNHAIYGTKKAPDVVDVPENITLGSNFDYEIIENENVEDYDNAGLEIVGRTNPNVNTAATGASETPSDRERLPISSLDDSASQPVRPAPMDASDSESGSDSEEDQGLSISAKNSSQSLAQLVFGNLGMTPATANVEAEHYPKDFLKEREPEAKHISEINPRYSSAELSKQPHSSSSLSDQFFSTGMTPAKNNTLADLFFNVQSAADTATSPMSLSFSGTQSPPVQPKTSPLPPHTTSANAFLGRSTPPFNNKESKSPFVFESDSESEDEFIEDVNPPSSSASSDRNNTTYASLYAVADRNGIPVSSPDSEESQKNKKSLAMANFLGSWNKGN